MAWEAGRIGSARRTRPCLSHPLLAQLGHVLPCYTRPQLRSRSIQQDKAGLSRQVLGQAKESAAEVVQLQRCFQEAQAQAEAAQQQNRQLLAANAELQARAEESYVQGQAAAAQIAGLQVTALNAFPSQGSQGCAKCRVELQGG